MNDVMLTTSLNMVNLVPTILGIMFLSGLSLKYFGKKKSVYIGAAGQIIGNILRGISFMFAWLPVILLAVVILSFKFVYRYDEEEPKVLAELARRKEEKSSEK